MKIVFEGGEKLELVRDLMEQFVKEYEKNKSGVLKLMDKNDKVCVVIVSSKILYVVR